MKINAVFDANVRHGQHSVNAWKGKPPSVTRAKAVPEPIGYCVGRVGSKRQLTEVESSCLMGFMSEYQYYEFAAIDRPLSEKQMSEVRALSTRAEITSTSFLQRVPLGRLQGRSAEADPRVLRCVPVLRQLGNAVVHVPVSARGSGTDGMEEVPG